MAHGYEKPAKCMRNHGKVDRESEEQRKSPHRKPRIRPALNTESPGDHDNQSPTRNGLTAGGLFGSCWHGFPPGLTVDGLCQFRRRRPAGYLKPQDNLRTEEGSTLKYRSEYKRRFQPFPLPSVSNGQIITTEPVKEISPTRYKYRPLDSFKLEYQDQTPKRRPNCQSSGLSAPLMPNGVASNQHEIESVHRAPPNRRGESKSQERATVTESISENVRPKLVRRPTSLHMEGELSTSTEKGDKFISYLLSKRPSLIRKSTNLKLEGDMNISTECREKFLPLTLTKRPPLVKKETNLHLEGDMEMEPEYKKKFTKYEVQKRPPLAKRETNLHLEGDLELDPEYREVFVEYTIEKVTPSRPVPNLKPEGDFDNRTETTTKFVEYSTENLKPVKMVRHSTSLHLEGEQEFNPDYRDNYKVHDMNNLRAQVVKQQPNLNLEGNIEFNPDYRENYVAHSLTNLRAEVVRKTPTLNLEGEHQFSPGYRETFTQHKLEKTEMKRPENNLKSPEGKLDFVSESSEKFKEHELVKRPDPVKESDKILLEGKIDMNPEYKNAYIDFSRSRPVVKKPVGEMAKTSDENIKKKRHKGEGVHSQNGVATLKSEGVMEANPEYKSSYVEHSPRDRTPLVKPPTNLKTHGQMEATAEKLSKQVESPVIEISDSKLEVDPSVGKGFTCQPEYRKAINDYIQRENIERLRPTESLPLKENEVPGVHRKPPTGDKSNKAFQVICTKGTDAEGKRLGPVHIESLNEKFMNGDLQRSPKRSILKPLQERSPSPGYRMRMRNTDDHKVGFRIRRRRSQDIRPISGHRKSATCTVSSISSDRARRVISPGTAGTSPVRRKRWNASNRESRKDSVRKSSFVVLSSDTDDFQNVDDKGCGDKKRHVARRGISKEDRINWMPPWYDAPI